jgi:hypothetical protein
MTLHQRPCELCEIVKSFLVVRRETLLVLHSHSPSTQRWILRVFEPSTRGTWTIGAGFEVARGRFLAVTEEVGVPALRHVAAPFVPAATISGSCAADPAHVDRPEVHNSTTPPTAP